jgi:hypothetical protein
VRSCLTLKYNCIANILRAIRDIVLLLLLLFVTQLECISQLLRQHNRLIYFTEVQKACDLKEAECGGVDWNELALDRNMWWALVNAVMNLRVP